MAGALRASGWTSVSLSRPSSGRNPRGSAGSEGGGCRPRGLRKTPGTETPVPAWKYAQGLPQKLLMLGFSFLLPGQGMSSEGRMSGLQRKQELGREEGLNTCRDSGTHTRAMDELWYTRAHWSVERDTWV